MNSLDIKKDRQKLQKQLERECTVLCQAVVKKRAGGRCEVTGIKGITESHHIFRRGTYPILRYEPDNQVALINKGHYKFHAQGENALKEFMIKRRGIEWYDNLVKIKQNQTFQWSVEKLQEQKTKLEKELNE